MNNKMSAYLKRRFSRTTVIVGATKGYEQFEEKYFHINHLTDDVRKPVIAMEPTQATPAIIYDVIADGTMTKVFSSLGASRKRWQESQIVAFYFEHWRKLRRRRIMNCNYFETTEGLVISMDFDPNGLPWLLWHEFSRDIYLFAEFGLRIIVPQ